ncbi:hypothetical protein [Parendozoicomonas haliclonae]|uniref:Uncharacterized protein n=1 Tax=Parendozoicomonas haliclonae TaxID=1960125 RepID=A0A1X7AP11_9GAMM|nr:hypothetical protein [Parendozoicomonas haliclonae]SMA49883.1 hypothetical protein EHSB41UT_03674 [Parendozoicomonas haliclonae]
MPSVSNPHRIIALKLLNLGWFDRRWFLARLPASARAAVNQHLEQLRKKGVQKLSYQDIEQLVATATTKESKTDENSFDLSEHRSTEYPAPIHNALVREAEKQGYPLEKSQYTSVDTAELTPYVRELLLCTFQEQRSAREVLL